MVSADEGLLQPLCGVGDDGPVVLLGARARGGDHGPRRHEPRGQAMRFVHHVPDVFVCAGLSRHDLAAVDDRPAAYGKDEVDALFAHQPRPLLHLGVGGVGPDAAEVHYVLAALVQPAPLPVVEPGAFQRAAAVGQQHVPPHAAHLFLDCAFGAPLAKMLADGVLISEVVHICCLLDIMQFIHCFSERGRTRRCTGIPEWDGSHIIIESSPHLPGATIVSACLSPGSSPGRRCTAGAALPHGCANCYGTRERKSRLPPRAVETILRAGIALQPRLAPRGVRIVGHQHAACKRGGRRLLSARLRFPSSGGAGLP